MAIKPEMMRLVELLLAHQQRLQVCTERRRPPLELIEGHALSLIHAAERSSASQLVVELGLEKSTLSRVLAGLEKSGYMAAREDKDDRRRQLLELTSNGIEILQKTNRLLSEAFLECVSPLSPSELKQLETVIRTLGDAFACPPAVAVPEIHPALRELRRLSRPFGILSAHFAATDLSAGEFQTLAFVCRSAAPQRATEISSRLNSSRTSTSRAVARLEKLKLVLVVENKTDGRSSLISATPAGMRLFIEAIERASSMLAVTLKPYGADYLSRLSRLLQTYTGAAVPSGVDGGEFAPARIESNSERQEACVFLVEELVRQGRQEEISEHLFSPGGRITCVRRNGVLVGVCDFTKRKNGWELERAVFTRQHVASDQAEALIDACQRLAGAAASRTRNE